MPILIPGRYRYDYQPPLGSVIDFDHPLAAGLIGFWPGNEGAGSTLADLAGGNHGVFQGTSPVPTWTTDSLPVGGYAVNYPNSTAAYVKLPDLSSRFASGQFTVAAWCRFTTMVAGERVFSARNGSGGFELFLNSTGGTMAGVAWTGSTIISPFPNGVAAGAAPAGSAHLHAFVLDSSGVATVYTDGLTNGGVSLGGPANIPASPLGWAIGRRSDSAISPMNGPIGPVYLWNRGLSVAELGQIQRNPFPFVLAPPAQRYFFFSSASPVTSSDSASLTSSQSVPASIAGPDSGALAESVAAIVADSGTDAASLSESTTLAVALSGTESATVSSTDGWTAAIDFRATSTFVSDGPGQTHSLGEVYPVTQAGLTFGWGSSGDAAFTRDTNNTVDPRFAGSMSGSFAGGTQRTFRIDLPSPGLYDVRLAIGSSNGVWTEHHVQIADGSTTLLTLDSGSTANLTYLDANNTSLTNLTWPASNQPARLNFASSIFNLTVGSLASTGLDTRLAHLALTKINAPLISIPGTDSASLTESASVVPIVTPSSSDSASLSESATLSTTEFTAAVNFRATAAIGGGTVDGPGQTYSLGEAYPTARAGFTFGWGAGDAANARNRTTTNDPRLCGMLFASATGGVTRTFLLDLPVPGLYAVRLALGDAAQPFANTNVVILDGSTPVLTIAADTTHTNTFWDAGYRPGESSIAAVDWPATNRAVRLNFTSTTLKLTIGSLTASGTDTAIAHLSVAHIADAGNPVSASDSVSLSESTSILSSFVASDAAAQSASITESASLADSGLATLTDSVSLFTGNTFSDFDPAAALESYALGLAYQEALSLAESIATDGGYGDFDSAAVVESQSIDATVSDIEPWSLSDVADVQPQGTTYASANDGSIVLDAVARLRATNEFSYVSAYETEDDRVRAADRNPVATVSLVNWDEMDDVDPIQTVRKIVLNVQVVARGKREEDRMKILSRVSNVVSNTLNGQSLADITFPDQTLCTRGRYRRRGVETILDVTLNAAYLIDGFSTHDTEPFIVSFYNPGSNLGAGSVADQDRATLTESIMLVSSNEGPLAISAADLAGVAESSVLTVTTFGTIEIGVTDSGTLAESTSLATAATGTVAFSLTDSASLAESTSLAISGSGVVSIAVADAFAATESSSLVVIPAGVVPVVVADLARFTEASSLAIATTGTVVVTSADAFGVSESSSLSVITTGEPAMLVLIGDHSSHLAMDGTSQVGSPLILPAAAILQSVKFSCAPNALAAPGDQWTAIVLRAPASGTGITTIANVNFNLASVLADPPLSLDIPIPGGTFALSAGDQLLCAVAPVANPADLASPGFTASLIWA